MIHLIQNLMTSPWVLVSIFFLLILILIFLSEYSYRKNILKPNINRKIIHLTVGVAISFSPFIFTSKIQPLILAIIFLIINHISYKKNRLKSFHNINRESYGTVFFPLAYILIATLFWQYKYIISCSFMILAVSDPLSSLIGENLKKPHQYRINKDFKSYEGSATMFISTFIILSLFSNLIFHQFNLLHSIITILICSITITFTEAVSIKGSDNLSIPITSFFIIEMFNKVNEQKFIIEFLVMIVTIIVLLFYFYKKKHLSLNGLLSSALMAVLILGFGGLVYLLPIATFFILSTLLSKIGSKHIQKSKSGRTTYQVIANGGIGLLLCIINHFHQTDLIFYMFLSSIAAANSDTWATEIGKLSKTRPKDIISGRRLKQGQSGGITFIGSLGSIVGSFVIAIIGFFLSIDHLYLILIFIAGFVGSLLDSILGSTIQSRFISLDGRTITEKRVENSHLYSGLRVINNDTVNLVCTISGPMIFALILIFV
tara:strand:+ start:54 stop:1514 length:1461 start_codon:yes stop_codon:yes gene_type:complete